MWCSRSIKMSNEGATSRGFSGPTKFSEFRKGATANAPPVIPSPAQPTSTKGASKASKEGKTRSLGQEDWLANIKEPYETSPNEVEAYPPGMVPLEKKDDHSLRHHLGQYLPTITQGLKDITHELKDLYESAKNDRGASRN